MGGSLTCRAVVCQAGTALSPGSVNDRLPNASNPPLDYAPFLSAQHGPIRQTGFPVFQKLQRLKCLANNGQNLFWLAPRRSMPIPVKVSVMHKARASFVVQAFGMCLTSYLALNDRKASKQDVFLQPRKFTGPRN